VRIFGEKVGSRSAERCEWTELRPKGLYGPLAAASRGSVGLRKGFVECLFESCLSERADRCS
jgi:hypothetical protein